MSLNFLTKPKLPTNEKLVGDKGYRGDDAILLKGEASVSKEELKMRSDALAAHERLNERLKKWSCMSTKRFRHDTYHHQMFADAVAVITQLEMEHNNGAV